MSKRRVLISGASFAGLSSAYWLHQLGYDVTVVEVSRGLRTGGTAVNIEGGTVEVARRMGILDGIRAKRLSLDRWAFKNADDSTARELVMRSEGDAPPDDAFEIGRDDLLFLMFDLVKDDVRFVFDDRITALHEADAGIAATFARAPAASFELVLGCDGMHSAVRALWFGPEAAYASFLGQYYSITIVDELLIERGTAQMYNEPGKAVMLNAYQSKTDIMLAFVSEAELVYDRRDEAQQRRIVEQQFAGVRWRTAELLRKVRGSTSFYFDKLCQIRMPRWTKGRVALVGDAGYCASPAAGLGGSLAIDGAAALGDALRTHADLEQAFRAYEQAFRPFLEEVQANALVSVETLIPRTAEAIHARNNATGPMF